MYGVLVFAAATQGLTLEYLALVARESYVSVPHKSVTIRKIVLGRLLPPRHCTGRQQTGIHTQLFCERGLLACPGTSVLRAGLRFDTHLGATKLLSENIGWEHSHCAVPLPHYCSLASPRIEHIVLCRGPIFVTAAQGTTLAWLWCPMGLKLAVLQDCIYLHSSKTVA